VFLFSAHSSESAEIRKELSIAASVQIPVFPLRLSEIMPSGALRYELATRQWIDLFPDRKKALATLADTIKKTVDPGSAAQAEPTISAAPQPNAAHAPHETLTLPLGSEE